MKEAPAGRRAKAFWNASALKTAGESNRDKQATVIREFFL